jgi:DNA polymerase-3 subunit alpha
VVDNVIILDAEVSPDEFKGGLRVTAKKVYSLMDARISSIRAIELSLNVNNLLATAVNDLKQLFLNFYLQMTKKASIFCCVVNILRATAVLQCGDNWRIYPHDDLIKRLKQVYGTQAVRLLTHVYNGRE